MSFSGKVKEELVKVQSRARHCQIAELASIIGFCGQIAKKSDGSLTLRIHIENEYVARKYFTLLKKTFNIDTEISIRENRSLHKSRAYSIEIPTEADSIRILQAVKILGSDMQVSDTVGLVDPIVVQKNCCRRAFIRGAFLCAGSMSDPRKSYHFEIVCVSPEKATQLQELICSFDIDAKVVSRKKYFVVYIKEGAQIVEMLGIMEASVAYMDLENIRILKDMRNAVNRKVNCETANINKTVNAAVKQMEDIRYIRDTVGLHGLSEGLQEIANLRLEYPEATLKELGMLLNPRVGKSGVNHRLRKLCNLADELRGNKEEEV
ncbi:MAG: DNA-binding protein WhiA [Lachnospiraceae bacterium]